jgi:hypothetical protein
VTRLWPPPCTPNTPTLATAHTNNRTFSTAGFFVKRAGSTLVLNNTVDDHGSVCLPLPATQAALAATPRPPAAPALHGTAAALLASQPRGSQQQLLTSTAASSAGPRGGNWCAAALRSGVLSLPRPLLPDLLQHDTAWALCSQPALLLGDTAWADTPVATANKSRPQAGKQAEAETAPARPPETFMVVAERSAVLCPKPVSTPSCWQGAGNSTGEGCAAVAWGWGWVADAARLFGVRRCSHAQGLCARSAAMLTQHLLAAAAAAATH